ncbi:MAG TPA: SDR family NAD(P)-dependent oxidoreductase, partial [Cytophagaceae bacterium]|nr:SDR family NAD(P)-dependent oxidoreductase [Cytophagaceae bacterium]
SEEIEGLEHVYNVRHIPCDLRKVADIVTVFDILKKENIHFNMLINNAGMIDEHIFLQHELKHQELQDILAVNLLAPMVLTDWFIKQLPPDREGCIVNIGSRTALVPDPSFLTYSASKAGLHAFSIGLREQLKSSGINVFEIIPPRVDTVMSRKVSKNKTNAERLEMMSSNDCAEQILEALQTDVYEFKIPAL